MINCTEGCSCCGSPSSEADIICNGIEGPLLLPLLSTECVDYVSCVDGEVAGLLSCSEGLLFDVNTGTCNDADLVECQPYEGGGGCDLNSCTSDCCIGETCEQCPAAVGGSNNLFISESGTFSVHGEAV